MTRSRSARAAAALCTGAAVFFPAIAGIAQTDGSAKDVELRISLSPYAGIDNGQNGEYYPRIHVGESVQDAQLIDNHYTSFRFVAASCSSRSRQRSQSIAPTLPRSAAKPSSPRPRRRR